MAGPPPSHSDLELEVSDKKKWEHCRLSFDDGGGGNAIKFLDGIVRTASCTGTSVEQARTSCFQRQWSNLIVYRCL